MRWDIFCRVIDNFGDIGICWRLAQQLAHEHAAEVRLWVDDLQSFACLCPTLSTVAAIQHIGPIEVRHWSPSFPMVEAADVVIEAFACEIPETYIEAMARRMTAPAWINLEYLSAEDWVEDCHLLASPRPQVPLTKYFFFPGFTSRTGGLLRERDLLATRNKFDLLAADDLWRALGIPPRSDDELRISLFCYDNPALPGLLHSWAAGPGSVRVLATPGAAAQQIARWLNQPLEPGTTLQQNSLTVHALPFLPPATYDRLLWACDVNFVRGEDSFVRAQWAQRPFVWQIYPQTDGAHLVKLDAFLARYINKFSATEAVRHCWHAWNGLGDMLPAWQEYIAKRQSIESHGKVWVSQLDHAGNLANNLASFVRGK